MSEHDRRDAAGIRETTGNGGLSRVEVVSALGTAEVYLHGAQVTQWQPSHAAAPVLWMSAHSSYDPAKPIRGGIPVCFPWFGAHDSDRAAPAHGFARLSDWTLTQAAARDDGETSLRFELAGERLSEAWPFRFRAALEVIAGATLTVALEVENRDDQPFTYEEALHTYFGVSDIFAISISGLERTTYLDKVGAGGERTQDDQPIRFTGETDRVYLETTAACVIDDRGLRRRIAVSKEHSRSTVVWNPWIAKAHAMADFGDDEWPGMVCVETANVGDAAVHLLPGERHRMTVRLAVEPY